MIGTRSSIKNDQPIIGTYHVNHEGSNDMYYKGANMLHTLRQLIEDDHKWRMILRGLNKNFYHQTVTTQQIEEYLNTHTKIDLTPFFNQYLRDTKIPTLEYKFDDTCLSYRYINIVDHFNIPIRLLVNQKHKWIYPNATWQTISLETDKISIDPNFYIHTKSL